MSFNKILLISAISLAFIVALSKIYNFYESHFPIAQPGECVEFTAGENLGVQIRVVENHRAEGTMDGIIELEFLPGLKVSIPVHATYEELRESGAKKAKCQ